MDTEMNSPSLTEEDIAFLELQLDQQLKYLSELPLNGSHVNGSETMSLMDEKIDHLMHSDTMILVGGLLAMIVLGLVFRSLCVRLTRENTRKKLVRESLKQIAIHMDMVTLSMSNNLELPNSPKTVIRTYSGRGRLADTEPDYSKEKRDSLKEIEFSDNLKEHFKEKEKEDKVKTAALQKRDSLKEIMFGNSNNNTEKEFDNENDNIISEKTLHNLSTSRLNNQSQMITNPDNSKKNIEPPRKIENLRELAMNNSMREQINREKHQQHIESTPIQRDPITASVKIFVSGSQ